MNRADFRKWLTDDLRAMYDNALQDGGNVASATVRTTIDRCFVAATTPGEAMFRVASNLYVLSRSLIDDAVRRAMTTAQPVILVRPK